MSRARAATRFYRLALRAFPDRHRAAYFGEMIETFEGELAQVEKRGWWRAAVFVVAASLNVVIAGLGERRRQRRAGFTPATTFSWLDLILAWRMLVRYPGLTIVGVFGMAVGIAIAAGAYTIVFALMDSRLPLPEGDRVVSLFSWDASTNNSELHLAHDFEAFRGLKSLEDIGLSRTVERNLIANDRQPDTVTVAEISASAFRVTRVAPLLGRYLLPEDERASAPDAMVIGYDEWRRRFAADPGIVGRSLQLGSTAYTVVGVMPEGFAFPVSHGFWVPWRLDGTAFEPRTGPVVNIFARLRPGATLDSAQAELAALGRQMSVALPATHQQLRPRVVPYTYAFNVMDDPENVLALHAIQVGMVLLLLVVCVNVAILVYARTATRQGEIAVRGALGASRQRIVMQLFVEALTLAGVAAALGLGLLSFAFSRLEAAILPLFGALPFWMTLRLSTDAVIYTVTLTLLAAAIIGVVPALKATGRQVQSRLQGLSAGSGARMQMGRLWTTLIVAQVALTVALLPASMFQTWQAVRFRGGDVSLATADVLTTMLVLDRASTAPPSPEGEREFRAQFAARQMELERRLMSEPAVSDVTFSLTGPGGERAAVLEVEGQPAPADPVGYNIVEGTKRGHFVRFNRIAPDFLAAFAVPVVVGRGFEPGDDRAGAMGASQGVLINRTMADSVFGGANPLGRRIRYVGRSREAAPRDIELNRWYEVVGVVANFPALTGIGDVPVSRVYHAAAPGDVFPARLAVRVRGADPATFAGTLRRVTAAVDPNLQLVDLSTAQEALSRDRDMQRLIGVTVIVVMLSVVVLCAAGIYALMSFTVARRRKEIGIRVALGADPRGILAGTFSRVFGQLAIGATVGMLGAIGLEQLLEGEMLQRDGVLFLPLVVVFMTGVGLLAAIGPARRGLRIQPTEALREE